MSDDDAVSEQVKTKELEELRRDAIRTALDSKKLEDIEKAANIAKLLADREKSSADVQTQSVAVRLERLKSVAAVFVPLLTLLTLAVTVGMQYGQLTATREANEDLKWRETVKMVLEQINRPLSSRARSPLSSDVPAADPYLATVLLKSYIGDRKYGKDATDISLLLLSRLPSSAFQDLFSSLQIAVTWDNLDKFVGLNRNLWSAVLDIDQRLSQLKAKKEQQDAVFNPRMLEQEVNELEEIRQSSIDQLIFISEKISEILHTKNPNGRAIDLNRALLLSTSLRGADLRGTNLRNAKFDGVNLSAAILDNIGGLQFSNSSWLDTNWWDANVLDGNLLVYLINTYYPYHGSYEYVSNKPPAKEVYTNKVRALCKTARASCPEKLLYGSVQKAQ